MNTTFAYDYEPLIEQDKWVAWWDFSCIQHRIKSQQLISAMVIRSKDAWMMWYMVHHLQRQIRNINMTKMSSIDKWYKGTSCSNSDWLPNKKKHEYIYISFIFFIYRYPICMPKMTLNDKRMPLVKLTRFFNLQSIISCEIIK